MAIFHLHVKMVSRSKGQSAVAKAAYNARAQLDNEHSGERHDYRRKKGLVFSAVFAPKDAPAWTHDRQALWSEVERHETRKNSQLAREIEIGLPHKFTDQQREWLVKDFVREQFTRRGLVADVVIHTPDRAGDERNHHAHLLLTTRYLTRDGFGAKTSDLEGRGQIAQWREDWAHLANRHLERHGHAARIDHRTLEAQGIDREPTMHLGPHVVAMHAKGIETDRGDQARTIAARNRTREDLQHADAEAQNALSQLHIENTIIHQPEPKEQPPAAPTAEAQLEKAITNAGKMADKGIMVASNIAGRSASKLMDVVSNFLDFFVGTPEPRKISTSEMLQSAEARKAYSAQQRAREQRDNALDRINEQLKKGQHLEHAAIGALSRSDLQHIKDQGDDGLRALVRQREAEHQRSHSGGRTRER